MLSVSPVFISVMDWVRFNCISVSLVFDSVRIAAKSWRSCHSSRRSESCPDATQPTGDQQKGREHRLSTVH